VGDGSRLGPSSLVLRLSSTKEERSKSGKSTDQTFLSLLEPLRDLLGPIMFQFEYLNRQKMRSQDDFQERFAGFLQEIPASYPYAFEVRNANYLNRSFFEFLDQNRLIPVLLQGYWMPPIVGLYKRWRTLILRHEMVVIRLLGPDRQGIEKETGKRWNQIVAPKDGELAAVASMVHDLLDRGIDVYLNVNNHYEGSAPLTIERFRQLFLTQGQQPTADR
jgi:uncharacterized protein YecE (DUF72 family)